MIKDIKALVIKKMLPLNWKNAFYALILFTLGCTNQSKQDNTFSSRKHHITQDSLFIPTELGDTLRFGKKKFNSIIDRHPEFFNELTESPDKLYYRFVHDVDFGSEQGQDVYYILYAHFLKQRNGVEKFAAQRKKLIDIYTQINSLFEQLQYGGAYFGHQQFRILGYAEYSVSLYPKHKNEIEKTYDISKQKELYIKSIRQLIADESEVDFDTLAEEKAKRMVMLNGIVDVLDGLITEIFYLRRAQEFQYGGYEYY